MKGGDRKNRCYDKNNDLSPVIIYLHPATKIAIMGHQAKKVFILTSFCNLLFLISMAQENKPQFTHADTLRGSMNAERAYNVLKYDISFIPDYDAKSIRGKNVITYID